MCRRRSSKVSCWAVSQSKYRPPSGFRPQEGVQLQEGPDGSLHLHAIAGHETTNEDAVAEIRVPDHGLANRIAGIVDDRFLGHLHPFIVDRHQMPTGFVAFPGRAMSVGDVAARYASWAANALEPRADIIRDIGVLAVVECPDRRGQHTDTDEPKYPHEQANVCLRACTCDQSRSPVPSLALIPFAAMSSARCASSSGKHRSHHSFL